MPAASIPVANRIQEIKKIFSDFGITVVPNSALDQTISDEFGRGKRSVLTRIITDLQPDSDAAVLAECIGHALAQEQDDPKIMALATVMRERIPSLLQICDIRQHTNKRIELLQQLLTHFEQKVQQKSTVENLNCHEERLLRMLASAKQQLRSQQQLHAATEVIYRAGVVCDVQNLQHFGKILQSITPILVALSTPGSSPSQITNNCVHALRVLSHELQVTQLEKAATILDDIHTLALINLPSIPEHATVTNVLQSLGISVGTMTIHKLSTAARNRGFTEKELTQVLFNNKEINVLSSQDTELLKATQQNQRFAATCGLISKLGQEVSCKELERVGIAGLCLICMRQTYYELKTHNANFVNFSESMGLFLSGLGVLTKNSTIVKLGNAVLTGVKAYSGVMAIPGGQVVAVPLAICAALGKLVLGERSKSSNSNNIPSDQEQLQKILQQVITLHTDMRMQFKNLFDLLHTQHKEYVLLLDRGFAQLTSFVQLSHTQTLKHLQVLEYKQDILQFSISKEFSDLYMEYIRDPLEEIEFYKTYRQGSVQQLQQNKLKLGMWLLYKAKHHKVNGKHLIAVREGGADLSSYVALILSKVKDYDSVLGMVNRYVNLEFAQQLPEELPHITTWIICANTYVFLLQNFADQMPDTDKEPEIIQSIIEIGYQVLSFVACLALDEVLLENIRSQLVRYSEVAFQEYCNLCVSGNINLLNNITGLCTEYSQVEDTQPRYANMSATEQLEQFDPLAYDINTLWQIHFKAHIPLECFAAERLGIGTIISNYTIDNAVNDFTTVHIPYSQTLLPDASRDVIFRIDVYFKTISDVKTPLVTGWFAYDLQNAQRRFDEYYQQKFQYGLRHQRYLWISLNGKQNCVAGHGITDTHKLIDYRRLAAVYQGWLQQAQPVYVAEIQNRLRQKPAFMQKAGDMLNEQKCVQVHNMDVLKLQLIVELRRKVYEQRMHLLQVLQNSSVINNALAKVDAYSAVLAIYQQIINAQVISKDSLQARLQQELQAISADQMVNTDFANSIGAILKVNIAPQTNSDYESGDFYQKINFIVTKLQLLLTQFNLQPALII